MERLWAPWRMTYIGGPRADGCVFCAQAGQSDEDALIVHRGERCYVVLNLYPYGSGHLMIVPFRHVAAPGRSRRGRAHRALGAARRSRWRRLAAGARARRVTTSASTSARPPAPGIEDHLHLHVVPRWNGDVNFMPVLADVRVMPQDLSETRTALVAAAWPT